MLFVSYYIHHLVYSAATEKKSPEIAPESPPSASTVEKGNRPTRKGLHKNRASTLGAIHPSYLVVITFYFYVDNLRYFTIRGTHRLESDESPAVLSLEANVARGTHFWLGKEVIQYCFILLSYLNFNLI